MQEQNHLDDPAWRRKALRLAARTVPNTSYECGVDLDHSDSRLQLSTMREHLVEKAHRAREKTLKALLQWATTGRWPPVRNETAFFLRRALHVAAAKVEKASRVSAEQSKTEADVPAPPWTMAETAWLLDQSVVEWYVHCLPMWAQHTAQEEFDRQEANHNSWNTLE